MKFSCFFLCAFSLRLLGIETLPIISDLMPTEAWLHFAKVGAAYYPIPEELKAYLAQAVMQANSLNSSCEGQYGYACEPQQQVEILMLEEKDWGRFSPEIQALAQGMSEIGKKLVVNLLQALDVDPELHEIITGGLSKSCGRNFFKMAHYDAKKSYPGIDWHKDIRWITVLYINQAGLQAKINGKIINIDPLEGHFVINLGVFFEAFINNPQLLTALEHQVLQVQHDRIAFGVFCNGAYAEKGFYQLNRPEILWRSPEYLRPFLVEAKDQTFSIPGHRVFHD